MLVVVVVVVVVVLWMLLSVSILAQDQDIGRGSKLDLAKMAASAYAWRAEKNAETATVATLPYMAKTDGHMSDALRSKKYKKRRFAATAISNKTAEETVHQIKCPTEKLAETASVVTNIANTDGCMGDALKGQSNGRDAPLAIPSISKCLDTFNFQIRAALCYKCNLCD